jgi:hypothetical protein
VSIVGRLYIPDASDILLGLTHDPPGMAVRSVDQRKYEQVVPAENFATPVQVCVIEIGCCQKMERDILDVGELQPRIWVM